MKNSAGIRHKVTAKSIKKIHPITLETDPNCSNSRKALEIIRGHGNTEMAGMLFISARTVETHRQRIMKKLSARSVVELQRLVARYGAS